MNQRVSDFMKGLQVVALIVVGTTFPLLTFADETALWKKLRVGQHVVLMRHALAPGFGDPDNFQVNDCSTQRNLSDRGREQAAVIGERFRKAGINKAEVYSSEWCRCLETARLLELGEVKALPIINSFFQQMSKEAKQTQALREWLLKKKFEKPLVLVTHQVNITAISGIFPASGEMVILSLEGGEISVVGTIETSA